MVRQKRCFRLYFVRPESIVVTGSLQEGKLIGEFHTEGIQDSWEACKKWSDPASGSFQIVFAQDRL